MPSRKRRAVAAAVLIAALSIGSLGLFQAVGAQEGQSGAAQSTDVSIDVEPSATFVDDAAVTVVVSGLEDVAGSQLVVYLCGNADASGAPRAPGPDSCFGPGDAAGYVEAEIDSSVMRIPYVLRLQAIGAANASCVAGLDVPCQLVVGVTSDDGAVIVATPVDDLVTMLQPEGRSALPVTGISPLTVGVALAGAALVYVGWLIWSVTIPAEQLDPRRP